MGIYKVVRTVERIEYVEAEDITQATSAIRSNHTELVTDEIVITETCEEVDITEAKMYWISKNAANR